jgi:hypothetical protein
VAEETKEPASGDPERPYQGLSDDELGVQKEIILRQLSGTEAGDSLVEQFSGLLAEEARRKIIKEKRDSKKGVVDSGR